MAHVDLYVRNTMLTVGEDYFLHSFFSTIAYQLEREGWGLRFPALMKELYVGRLPRERVPQAREEVKQIRKELCRLPPDARIYAYEKPDMPTPWPVPPGAKTLADCFLSSNGKNVLDLLERALDLSDEVGADLEIRALDEPGTYNYYVTGKKEAEHQAEQ
jgi:2,3-bisphosphoglycerate-dependent phosphoglycerate mutase